MTRVFLASRNAKKLAELRRILEDALPGVEVLGLDAVASYDEPAETEPTFAGNAVIKARAGREATRLVTIADDSGLCVDELNGMPGVLSARWSGAAKDDAANNSLLLAQLRDTPDERRGAEFRCAVALCMPDGHEEITQGVMRGRIITAERGAAGFGYDPIFVPDGQPDGQQLTSAELKAEDKDAISHRGQALRALAPVLARLLTSH
ncbi:MAG: RdgB/HAM1 family non-canonical purine NTP pyrophosphatase [Nocardioidaceae bacterium]|nr:RdgB/HAM1 family non-canonical purine NTP pyrophosphatase [Nocardioidaceae bacterium]